MADHLAVLKWKTSYNSEKKAFSEIHRLKTFLVQHILGLYVHFVVCCVPDLELVVYLILAYGDPLPNCQIKIRQYFYYGDLGTNRQI